MKPVFALIIATLLSGCAATGSEYAKVYDRKYNEYRLVTKDSAGAFVGTSATKQPVRAAGQHP